MEQKMTRKEQARRTKQKIFDTAVALIKAQGYEQVTVSQICQEAGLAKGSFYVHYRTKEDIIRESYYSDMDAFIRTAYDAYVREHPQAPAVQRIEAFLCLELDFAVYAGYELTCLAYSMNFSACVPGPSEHFQRRPFSGQLRELLAEAAPLLAGDFGQEDAFSYLESVVRGLMATWCFSNGAYDLLGSGKSGITHTVKHLFSRT
ncbi:TetR/AcrR family transcriptional regulator [uncultured Dysosmobacter sp.]|uniref:TetR/AcrR family transcriptional regulator n=1 Tax=uncultured Dysosmobacter sp. TaxID=2591384 RepID=UPI00261F82E7|nr:TetR/AcrR family transcriptional regulator [uncultured Dysosmobacter sp.]